ncbi:hypothetical protein NHX12_011454 [Muraenolepis orangiensis]|uniref:Insulin n=1 Tax=Muraenolepis orangiensis TaxID=630683 RepID=A0A9Q0I6P9_9TELE|nr:hypothetical protein NHX12_011454 [Muraenolepis orangiensis]
MARVPWAASMLLLLVVVLLLAVPQPAVAPISTRHLCGSHLVDALYFVCGEQGFFYSPRRAVHKRDVQRLLGVQRQRAELLEQSQSGGHRETKVKRGIVEQCCHRPCSIHHLEDYCD